MNPGGSARLHQRPVRASVRASLSLGVSKCVNPTKAVEEVQEASGIAIGVHVSHIVVEPIRGNLLHSALRAGFRCSFDLLVDAATKATTYVVPSQQALDFRVALQVERSTLEELGQPDSGDFNDLGGRESPAFRAASGVVNVQEVGVQRYCHQR